MSEAVTRMLATGFSAKSGWFMSVYSPIGSPTSVSPTGSTRHTTLTTNSSRRSQDNDTSGLCNQAQPTEI